MTVPPPDLVAIAALRLQLWEGCGYRPLAVLRWDHPDPEQAGKAPLGREWPERARRNPPEATTFPAVAHAPNTGILADGLRAVDVDVDDRELAGHVRARMFEMLGHSTLRHRANSGRCLAPYRAAEGMPKKRVLAGGLGKIEILGCGQQFVAFGRHKTGAELQWTDPLQEVPLTSLPTVSEDQITTFLRSAALLIEADPADAEEKRGGGNGGHWPQFPAGSGQDRANILDVIAALAVIPNIGPPDWEAWNNVGMAVWRETGGSEPGFLALIGWSSQHPQHDIARCRERWANYLISPPNATGAGKLFALARLACPGWRRPSEIANSARAAATEEPWEDQEPSCDPPTGPDDDPNYTKAVDQDATSQPVADDGRPVIQVVAGKLDAVATAAENALIASGLPIFQRGIHLVRPFAWEAQATGGQTTLISGVSEMTVPSMLDRFCRAAAWCKWDGRSKGFVACNPPSQVAAVLLDRVGEWRFPIIAGVITTPTLRPDGSLLTAPGYDPVTQLYLQPDPNLVLPGIPEMPTQDETMAALKLLDGLLDGFPFVDAASRSVALSGLITPVARGMFPVVPLHAFAAPDAGTGKSYLVDTACAIVSGQLCPVVAAGKTEEETEKRLDGMLLKGAQIINIDNVNGELGGDKLCQLVERPRISVRKLGESKPYEIDAKVTAFATGNNLILRGDMTRRALRSLLDAKMERPETRSFKFDPVKLVLADRGLYVAAALTVVRGFLTSGARPALVPLQSFEPWSNTIRAALVWLEKADPCATMETARAEDPERLALTNVLSAWHTVFGTEEKTAAEVAAKVIGFDPEGKGGEKLLELRTALAEVAAVRNIVDATRLGYWLRKYKGKIVSGLKFIQSGTAHGGTAKWKVSA